MWAPCAYLSSAAAALSPCLPKVSSLPDCRAVMLYMVYYYMCCYITPRMIQPWGGRGRLSCHADAARSNWSVPGRYYCTWTINAATVLYEQNSADNRRHG